MLFRSYRIARGRKRIRDQTAFLRQSPILLRLLVEDKILKLDFRVLHFDSVESTNTAAADQARRGADEGLTVVADRQTSGRGRQGRNWSSRKHAGAYFSIVLRPQLDVRFYSLIPLMAAIAVAEALAKWSIEADIKWPNDILVDEKKLCGILTEMIDTPHGNAVILGVGINLRDTDPKLNAAALDHLISTGISRDEVVAAVHRHLSPLYEELHADPQAIVNKWSRRSPYAEGLEVTVDLGNGETLIGTTCGLAENGALRVRMQDGSVYSVQSGDVHRLRKAAG